ncbi:NACHT domain-containing protein [Cryptosporangium aurantiacum]|uniref:NACHT domain-containing protein n=2 Tax=Cryptosporangium aurantiacum TaxID=134849 RepID=A0A1M7R304_9ACTN|nr:NACHT domain-containing protein [Cryptosporangium aurantiacum]
MGLSELVNVRFGDDFRRRRFSREVEAMADAVAQRLLPLCRQELSGLDVGERNAALSAVAASFEATDLSDASLFAIDVDAMKLAQRLRAHLPNATESARLSEAGSRFYDVVLDECCACYVELIVHLPPFTARATTEVLGRMSRLAEQVDVALQRLPARTLLAPHGTAHDEEFRLRYLRLVSETLDEMELFGVDIRSYRPRTTLSVAYISLSVTTRVLGRRIDRTRPYDSAQWRAGAAASPRDTTVRVEQALGSATRILVRGDAGSGKSTLLKWLAINSARGTFSGDLAQLNGHTPFLIKLRSYAGRSLPKPEEFLDDLADPLAALMPEGFAHRRLAAGTALVLVDGIDELPADERRRVRDWLRKLVRTFPDSHIVVTSRPAAAADAWLEAEGFGSAFLERISSSDIRTLIRRWHDAVRDADSLPCDPRELPRYEAALLGRLDGSADLRALATIPLLCAMLCALNLDRRTYLPRDRIAIYHAALTLLLDRRDAERQIPSARTLDLGPEDKRQLLRHLAWRLTVNGRSELSRSEAVRRIADKLAALPHLRCDADGALDHLVHRSGVLREPAADRIDFAHRTFQEYLTAEEAADQGDIGLLVQNAHLDLWRDVVVMAAGLANSPLRHELISGLLDRAEVEPRNRRRLRLLAASCLETAPALARELANRVEKCMAELLPARATAEARSLSSVGASLLPRMLVEPQDLSEAAAAATIRTAALINGSEVWPVLERFAADPRHRVQSELISVWEYFDPDEYADRILADAPLLNGSVTILNPTLLTALTRLRRLTELHVRLHDVTDLESLAGLPHLRGLFIDGDFEDLTALAPHTELESVLVGTKRRLDPEPLTRLPKLSRLFYYPGHVADLEFIRSMALTVFAVSETREVTDLSALGTQQRLTSLYLYGYADNVDLSAIRELSALRSLELGRTGTGSELNAVLRPRIAQLAALAPALNSLGFLCLSIASELPELARFKELDSLSIRSCDVSDYSPLSKVPSLTRLEVAPTGGDLSFLAGLRSLDRLAELTILSSPDDAWKVDLSPLGNRPLTVRLYRDLHRVVGVGKGVRVKWIDIE